MSQTRIPCKSALVLAAMVLVAGALAGASLARAAPPKKPGAGESTMRATPEPSVEPASPPGSEADAASPDAASPDAPPDAASPDAPSGALSMDEPLIPMESIPMAVVLPGVPAMGSGASGVLAMGSEQSDQAATSGHGKLISAGGLGTMYAALSVWAYFAWYYNVPELPAFKVSGDGWFGQETYAGGADKLGHAWATYVISRASTRMLASGGWSRLEASVIASGMSVLFFTFVEVKDGFYYQFSLGDSVGNAAGSALSFLVENLPGVDDILDFRLEYRPSSEYIDNLFGGGDVNVAEDYSGQSYMLALHLRSVPGLTETPWASWARYLDIVTGFESRDYKPKPTDPDARRRQSLFVGVSLNLQQILDRAYGGPPTRTSHRIGHAFFEIYSPPYTTWRMATSTRSPD